MAYSPISNTVPKYESGQTLKAYTAGTSNLLQMATDSSGVTLVNYVVCNASGYPAVSGNVVIPHINAAYKLALYPTEAAAIANSGAIWTIDNLTPTSIVANIDFSGNTISSTNTNGDITLDPNGSGEINLNANVVGSGSATFSTLTLTSAPDVSGYVNGIRFYLNENGSNATSFSLSGNITEDTFESVGPTSSGATNIWTALDDLPSGARIALIKFRSTSDPVAADLASGANLFARKTGSSTAFGPLTNLCGVQWSADDDVGGTDNTVWMIATVPLDSSRRVDLTWGADNAESMTLQAYLIGFWV